MLYTYATCEGPQCKALCEDSVDLKIYNLYDTNNSLRYDGVPISKQGQLFSLFEELINEDGKILMDNRNKWSL